MDAGVDVNVDVDVSVDVGLSTGVSRDVFAQTTKKPFSHNIFGTNV